MKRRELFKLFKKFLPVFGLGFLSPKKTKADNKKKLPSGLCVTAYWAQPYNSITGKVRLDKTKVCLSGLERNVKNRKHKFWRHPLKLKYSKPFTQSYFTAFSDICEIPTEYAQYLFDSLWRLGFRPE